jgi:hypothetical protein
MALDCCWHLHDAGYSYGYMAITVPLVRKSVQRHMNCVAICAAASRRWSIRVGILMQAKHGLGIDHEMGLFSPAGWHSLRATL